MKKNNKENFIMLGVAIGQCHPDLEPGSYIEQLIDYVERFNFWEKREVLSLPEGWESFQERGGEDYESAIYRWAKHFEIW